MINKTVFKKSSIKKDEMMNFDSKICKKSSAYKNTMQYFFVIIFSLFISNNVVAEININSVNPDSVYTVVDAMPEVEGGISEVYKHIDYPREAQRQQIEGRVFIKFIVNEYGGVESPEIMKDIGAGCGQAAIDGIKKVKFKPGLKNGQPVKVYFTIPINFKLSN